MIPPALSFFQNKKTVTFFLQNIAFNLELTWGYKGDISVHQPVFDVNRKKINLYQIMKFFYLQ